MLTLLASADGDMYNTNQNLERTKLQSTATIKDVEVVNDNLLEEKLLEAFPHLEEDILNATTEKNISASRIAQQDVSEIVYREGKWIDEEEYIAIAFDEEGAYSAYSISFGTGKKNWSGGTTSSGTSYKNVYNAILTVSNSCYLYTVTIFPISYSIVNNGYDSFIDTGIATTPIDSCVTANPVQMKETASSYAYAYYNVNNVLILEQSTAYSFPVEIRIKNDNVYVYLFNQQI